MSEHSDENQLRVVDPPNPKKMADLTDPRIPWFFSEGDWDTYKRKINGLSVSVDYLKAGFGALALGFTPVKIDGALFKMDEKGISFGGVQNRTWPWAREGSSFWRVVTSKKDLAKYDEKKAREQAQEGLNSKLEKEVRQIKKSLTKNAQEAKKAHLRIDKIQDRLRVQRQGVRKVAAQPNASEGNPRRLKGTVDQVKALEQRLNTLMAALG
ncbi:hypothetical protein ACMATS_21375 [Streptoverticillium reticulum]|uniref:hypothetical protein n=1 Tax=Streptoverticillium reticulum TaxID=1433415 RepID=UPI0039BF1636